MEDATATPSLDLTELTSGLVAAYVSHNSVQLSSLPELIASVHASLTGLGKPRAPLEPAVEKLSAAEIRKSIKPDGIVSFIDGKRYKTLKRHLTRHGLDAAGYRAKYGLPHDYPMVAASYAEQRSQLARSFGLGRLHRKGEPLAEADAPKERGRKPADAKTASTVAVKAKPTKKIGRPPKAVSV